MTRRWAHERKAGREEKLWKCRGCGKRGKPKAGFPLFPRAPWKSRQQQARFPHFHSSDDEGGCKSGKPKAGFPLFHRLESSFSQCKNTPWLKRSREMTILCSPKVIQHHRRVRSPLPGGTPFLPVGKIRSRRPRRLSINRPLSRERGDTCRELRALRACGADDGKAARTPFGVDDIAPAFSCPAANRVFSVGHFR